MLFSFAFVCVHMAFPLTTSGLYRFVMSIANIEFSSSDIALGPHRPIALLIMRFVKGYFW